MTPSTPEWYCWPKAGQAEYLLTPKGRELGPALRALQLWGRKHTT